MSEQEQKPSTNATKVAIICVCIAICAAIIAAVLVFNSSNHSSIRIDEKTFPDERLRSIVALTFDADEDGALTEDEVSAVSSLTLVGVNDFTGLESITDLDELIVEESPSKQVVFPEGVHAKRLVVIDPELTQLAVSPSPDIEELVASNTLLQSFDPAGVPHAAKIDIANTQVTTLDVSSNSNLEVLLVDQNVSIKGLESTKLHEHWIPASFSYQLYSTNNQAIGRSRSASAQFNENDLISKLSYRDENLSDWTFAYDEDGKCISYTASTNGRVSKIYELSYDENDRVTAIKAAQGSEETVFAYDEGSAPVSCTYMSSAGKSSDAYDFAYSQDGLLARFTQKPEGRIALEGGVTTCDIGYSAGRPVTIEFDYSGMRSGGYKVVRTSSGGIEKVLYVEDGDVKNLTQGASTSVTTYSYDEKGHLEDAVRIVANSSSSMLPVSKTSFTYGENELPTSWRIDYVGSYRGYKDVHAVVDVAYWRVLTTDDSFASQKAILLGDVFDPTFSLGFVNPLAQIEESKNIAYDGISECFHNYR